MSHFKSLLIIAIFIFFSSHSSWGMDNSEQEAVRASTSAAPSLNSTAREITKEDFFAKYSDDIKVKKPIPRPGPSFSLVNLKPEKLANLRTYDPIEIEKQEFLMFHGVYFENFNAVKFNQLYGDYIDCEDPTLTQMLLGGLWSNLCMSASLIHPSKAPTWSPYGVTLRIPYQLICMTYHYDLLSGTHSTMIDTLRTVGDSCITELQRVECMLVGRDECFLKTDKYWHNEIHFVPEAIVDGIPYSVTVTGLWARDYQIYSGQSQPISMASPKVLAKLKRISEELGIPLVLLSEWEKK
ncbi:hypothetical protein QM565_09065 [Geitlerinema splendidum]|nr:hypothetical protein [Geitlerinema splendidum]